MKRHAAALAVAAGLLAGASPAARSAEAPAAPETIVLKAAHLFDSTGTALKDGATIVVRGDHIMSSEPPQPPRARGHRSGCATILPLHRRAHASHARVPEGLLPLHLQPRDALSRRAGHVRRHVRATTLEAGFTTCAMLARTTSSMWACATPSMRASPRVRHPDAVHGLGSPGGISMTTPSHRQSEAVGPVEGICSGPEQCAKRCATR